MESTFVLRCEDEGPAEVARALEPVQFMRLRLLLRAVEPLALPRYKGSSFRGAFGVAFKQAVCVAEPGQRECSQCLLRSGCPYPYVFDTPTALLGAAVRGHTAAPHPFVLVPPLEDKERYETGESLGCELVLIGEAAIRLLPYFIYVFEWMGRRNGLGKGRGHFRVDSVEALSETGWATVYAAPDYQLSQPVIPLNIANFWPRVKELSTAAREALSKTPIAGDQAGFGEATTAGGMNAVQKEPPRGRVRLRFISPCRLVRGGQLADEPAFAVIARALLRRFDDLARYHCGGSLPLNRASLISLAEQVQMIENNTRWYDWERYSKRQDTHMKLGGIMGEAVYEGPLLPFVPLLVLGENLHVGKNTAFGLGKFEVEGWP